MTWASIAAVWNWSCRRTNSPPSTSSAATSPTALMVVDCVSAQGITHIIHLAALQVPFCKADPVAGARVNVVGTVNVFEAAKAAGLGQVVYASSIAVYGPAGHYADAILPADAPLFPQTHYGVYKQANEGTARIFWQDDGIASVALRPYTIYGPARDQGLTSEPTKAMLAASGRRLSHPLAASWASARGGRGAHLRAGHAHARGGRTRLQPARRDRGHAHGHRHQAAAPDVAGRISYDERGAALPQGFDDRALSTALGATPDTSLVDGVAKTVDHFRCASRWTPVLTTAGNGCGREITNTAQNKTKAK
ncbi:MAG: NAD-dependent epimerase/dehydratase family protein [Caldilineaceae bacterium]